MWVSRIRMQPVFIHSRDERSAEWRPSFKPRYDQNWALNCQPQAKLNDKAKLHDQDKNGHIMATACVLRQATQQELFRLGAWPR